MIANGFRVSFGGVEKVLELDRWCLHITNALNVTKLYAIKWLRWSILLSVLVIAVV